MRDYKKLEVWKKSHELTLFVYGTLLPKFPKSEQFDLLSQTKRAAYSIPLNIVEGSGRYTEKDFAHFLDQALGSAHELEYCCLLSKDLSYFDPELFTKTNLLINEVKAMIIGLIKKLRG
ncbi:four helix bundle protein [Mucilaginibacter ginsenosidivorans]|uniref:Four helix bundle protein n=1 Tax=Mucilaginibacter ginsenosidivorans TaxID=398053 RepID=A0A5B8UZU4_9SPHI|nr:four helix bundle protein [Mucilaginibacter ginsenosidivorans]QEC64458.1 four helix bundle protein [Mucilaginibacter ginsenosidivorans]